MKEIVGLDVEYYTAKTGGLYPSQIAIIREDGTVYMNQFFKVPDGDIPISKKKVTYYKSKEFADWETYKPLIAEFLKDKIIVGHYLENDLKVLGLSGDAYETLDTAKLKPYMQVIYTSRRLKNLALQFLNRAIQPDTLAYHDAAEDARASLNLAKLYRNRWPSKDAIPSPRANTGNTGNMRNYRNVSRGSGTPAWNAGAVKNGRRQTRKRRNKSFGNRTLCCRCDA